jgi:hypothetical protein
MAPDGGLYVPERWPSLGLEPKRVVTTHYANVAAHALKAFAGADLSDEDVLIASDAYIDIPADPNDLTWRGRWPEAVTPLRQIRVADWMLGALPRTLALVQRRGDAADRAALRSMR